MKINRKGTEQVIITMVNNLQVYLLNEINVYVIMGNQWVNGD